MQPRKPEDVPDYKVAMWNKVWDRLPKDGQAECFGKCGLARVSKGTPLLFFWWTGESNLFWQNYGTCFLWLDSWSLFAAPQVASAITSPMSTRTPSSEMSVAWDA